MRVDGIPDSIEWAHVARVLTDLGIDLERIPASSSVQIGWDAITCVLYAENPDGDRYIDGTTDEAAVHHISIPIVRNVYPRLVT